MKIFVCPQPDEMGKFYGVIGAFPNIWVGSVLDVGCRSGHLREALRTRNRRVEYCGFDLCPPANVIGNLGKGLPFDDKTFDVVVALDVLEHIDDIHRAFDELCRVASQYVVLALPNAYELKTRLKFVLGLPLSGKYGLPIEPPADRHRWLFSFGEARRFVHHQVQCCGFAVKDEGCLIGRRRANAVGKLLIGRFPALFSPWQLCLLARREAVTE